MTMTVAATIIFSRQLNQKKTTEKEEKKQQDII